MRSVILAVVSLLGWLAVVQASGPFDCGILSQNVTEPVSLLFSQYAATQSCYDGSTLTVNVTNVTISNSSSIFIDVGNAISVATSSLGAIKSVRITMLDLRLDNGTLSILGFDNPLETNTIPVIIAISHFFAWSDGALLINGTFTGPITISVSGGVFQSGNSCAMILLSTVSLKRQSAFYLSNMTVVPSIITDKTCHWFVAGGTQLLLEDNATLILDDIRLRSDDGVHVTNNNTNWTGLARNPTTLVHFDVDAMHNLNVSTLGINALHCEMVGGVRANGSAVSSSCVAFTGENYTSTSNSVCAIHNSTFVCNMSTAILFGLSGNMFLNMSTFRLEQSSFLVQSDGRHYALVVVPAVSLSTMAAWYMVSLYITMIGSMNPKEAQQTAIQFRSVVTISENATFVMTRCDVDSKMSEGPAYGPNATIALSFVNTLRVVSQSVFIVDSLHLHCGMLDFQGWYVALHSNITLRDITNNCTDCTDSAAYLVEGNRLSFVSVGAGNIDAQGFVTMTLSNLTTVGERIADGLYVASNILMSSNATFVVTSCNFTVITSGLMMKSGVELSHGSTMLLDALFFSLYGEAAIRAGLHIHDQATLIVRNVTIKSTSFGIRIDDVTLARSSSLILAAINVLDANQALVFSTGLTLTSSSTMSVSNSLFSSRESFFAAGGFFSWNSITASNNCKVLFENLLVSSTASISMIRVSLSINSSWVLSNITLNPYVASVGAIISVSELSLMNDSTVLWQNLTIRREASPNSLVILGSTMVDNSTMMLANIQLIGLPPVAAFSQIHLGLNFNQVVVQNGSTIICDALEFHASSWSMEQTVSLSQSSTWTISNVNIYDSQSIRWNDNISILSQSQLWIHHIAFVPVAWNNQTGMGSLIWYPGASLNMSDGSRFRMEYLSLLQAVITINTTVHVARGTLIIIQHVETVQLILASELYVSMNSELRINHVTVNATPLTLGNTQSLAVIGIAVTGFADVWGNSSISFANSRVTSFDAAFAFPYYRQFLIPNTFTTNASLVLQNVSFECLTTTPQMSCVIFGSLWLNQSSFTAQDVTIQACTNNRTTSSGSSSSSSTCLGLSTLEINAIMASNISLSTLYITASSAVSFSTTLDASEFHVRDSTWRCVSGGAEVCVLFDGLELREATNFSFRNISVIAFNPAMEPITSGVLTKFQGLKIVDTTLFTLFNCTFLFGSILFRSPVFGGPVRIIDSHITTGREANASSFAITIQQALTLTSADVLISRLRIVGMAMQTINLTDIRGGSFAFVDSVVDCINGSDNSNSSSSPIQFQTISIFGFYGYITFKIANITVVATAAALVVGSGGGDGFVLLRFAPAITWQQGLQQPTALYVFNGSFSVSNITLAANTSSGLSQTVVGASPRILFPIVVVSTAGSLFIESTKGSGTSKILSWCVDFQGQSLQVSTYSRVSFVGASLVRFGDVSVLSGSVVTVLVEKPAPLNSSLISSTSFTIDGFASRCTFTLSYDDSVSTQCSSASHLVDVSGNVSLTSSATFTLVNCDVTLQAPSCSREAGGTAASSVLHIGGCLTLSGEANITVSNSSLRNYRGSVWTVDSNVSLLDGSRVQIGADATLLSTHAVSTIRFLSSMVLSNGSTFIVAGEGTYVGEVVIQDSLTVTLNSQVTFCNLALVAPTVEALLFVSTGPILLDGHASLQFVNLTWKATVDIFTLLRITATNISTRPPQRSYLELSNGSSLNVYNITATIILSRSSITQSDGAWISMETLSTHGRGNQVLIQDVVVIVTGDTSVTSSQQRGLLDIGSIRSGCDVTSAASVQPLKFLISNVHMDTIVGPLVFVDQITLCNGSALEANGWTLIQSKEDDALTTRTVSLSGNASWTFVGVRMSYDADLRVNAMLWRVENILIERSSTLSLHSCELGTSSADATTSSGMCNTISGDVCAAPSCIAIASLHMSVGSSFVLSNTSMSAADAATLYIDSLSMINNSSFWITNGSIIATSHTSAASISIGDISVSNHSWFVINGGTILAAAGTSSGLEVIHARDVYIGNGSTLELSEVFFECCDGVTLDGVSDIVVTRNSYILVSHVSMRQSTIGLHPQDENQPPQRLVVIAATVSIAYNSSFILSDLNVQTLQPLLFCQAELTISVASHVILKRIHQGTVVFGSSELSLNHGSTMVVTHCSFNNSNNPAVSTGLSLPLTILTDNSSLIVTSVSVVLFGNDVFQPVWFFDFVSLEMGSFLRFENVSVEGYGTYQSAPCLVCINGSLSIRANSSVTFNNVSLLGDSVMSVPSPITCERSLSMATPAPGRSRAAFESGITLYGDLLVESGSTLCLSHSEIHARGPSLTLLAGVSITTDSIVNVSQACLVSRMSSSVIQIGALIAFPPQVSLQIKSMFILDRLTLVLRDSICTSMSSLSGTTRCVSAAILMVASVAVDADEVSQFKMNDCTIWTNLSSNASKAAAGTTSWSAIAASTVTASTMFASGGNLMPVLDLTNNTMHFDVDWMDAHTTVTAFDFPRIHLQWSHPNMPYPSLRVWNNRVTTSTSTGISNQQQQQQSRVWSRETMFFIRVWSQGWSPSVRFHWMMSVGCNLWNQVLADSSFPSGAYYIDPRLTCPHFEKRGVPSLSMTKSLSMTLRQRTVSADMSLSHSYPCSVSLTRTNVTVGTPPPPLVYEYLSTGTVTISVSASRSFLNAVPWCSVTSTTSVDVTNASRAWLWTSSTVELVHVRTVPRQSTSAFCTNVDVDVRPLSNIATSTSDVNSLSLEATVNITSAAFACAAGGPAQFQLAFTIMFTATAPPVRTTKRTPSTGETATDIAVTASVLPLAMVGGPVGVLVIRRVMVQYQLAACQYFPDDSVDLSTSPTQMNFGPSAGQYQRGAVLGNTVLLLCMVVVAVVLAAVRRFYHHRRQEHSDPHHPAKAITLWRSMASLSLPGWIFPPSVFLLQPLVSMSVGIIVHQATQDGATDVLLGLVGLIVGFGPFVWMIWLTTRGFQAYPIENPVRIVSSPPTFGFATIRWLVVQLLFPKFHWRNVAPESHFLGHYGVVFEPYKKRRQWFGCIDVGLSMLNGVAGGVQPDGDTSVCSRIILVMTVVNGLYVISIWILSPYNARLDATLSIVNGVCSFVWAPIVFLGFASAATYITLVQLWVSVVGLGLLSLQLVLSGHARKKAIVAWELLRGWIDSAEVNINRGIFEDFVIVDKVDVVEMPARNRDRSNSQNVTRSTRGVDVIGSPSQPAHLHSESSNRRQQLIAVCQSLNRDGIRHPSPSSAYNGRREEETLRKLIQYICVRGHLNAVAVNSSSPGLSL